MPSRPARLALAAAISLVGAAAALADGRADAELDAWLADRGLRALAADILERRLERTTGDDRAETAERLARLYARLLDETSDPDLIDRYTARGQALLELVPPTEASSLRLSLARTSFRQTERLAERARLRFEDAGDPVIAARRFRDLLTEFDRIADTAATRVAALERQQRAGGGDDRLVDRALAESRRDRSLASFLAGWAATYIADLEQNPGAADHALVRLGRLLNALEDRRPDIDRLSEQMLRLPHVARAAIATSLCFSVKGSPERALEWLGHIEGAPGLAEGVGDQIVTTRVMVLARASRWADVVALERERLARSGSPGPTRERLLAVLALDALSGAAARGSAREARDLALTQLASGGHIDHIIELARFYGPDSFGSDTFISMHVRALIAYDHAREAHRASGANPDEPAGDPAIVRLYRDAGALLEHAIGREDALDQPQAMSAAATLVGLCLFYAGDHGVSTADQFVAAAENAGDPVRAANALWMAIHSLDRAIEDDSPDASELSARRSELIDRFLREHPSHERAAALVVQRASDPSLDHARALDMLLSIAADNPMFETARRQAARRAYQLARVSPEDEREFRRLQYLRIAVSLLRIDRRRASAGDNAAAAEAAVRARRIAEVALAKSAPDIQLAQNALDALRSLAAAGQVDLEPLAAELDFRRAQMAIVQDDHEEAQRLFARAADANPSLALPAAQEAYVQALRRLAAVTNASPPEQRAAALRVVSSGARLLEELDRRGRGLDEPAVLTVLARTADAATTAAVDHDDRPAAEVAVELYERWLAQGTPSAEALRNLGRAARRSGRPELAMDAWRRLSSAAAPSTPMWYEARIGLMEVLADREADRARTALEQHLVLYPGPAPEPWQARIERLAGRLGVRLPERAS